MRVVAVSSRAVRGAVFAAALAALVLSGTAQAKSWKHAGCRSVYGRYTSSQLPPDQCNSPVGFCTHGSLTGGLSGSYTFVMSTAMQAPDPDIPGVTFYTGTSNVDLAHGGSVVGVDSGTVDLSPVGTGKQAALITIIDGTGDLQGATGYLILRGTLDFATGDVSGDYEGQICTQ